MSETPPRRSWIEHCTPRGRALVIAHRGGAGLRPENTIAAFDHAAALGVDAVELDVRLSRDGEPVVVHDADLDRTTDASGPVVSRTADDLARVDAGFRFEAAAGGFAYRGQGFGVPRLRDVLARYREMAFIIELKGTDPAVAEAAARVVIACDARDRVCFGGFDAGMLRAARARAPGVCTGASREEIRRALYWSYVWWAFGRRPYEVFQVPEVSGSTRVVSPRFVRAAHRAGKLVQVWTVNDEPGMRRLIDWGVDGLITDRPDVALEVVGLRQPAGAPWTEARAVAPATAPGRSGTPPPPRTPHSP